MILCQSIASKGILKAWSDRHAFEVVFLTSGAPSRAYQLTASPNVVQKYWSGCLTVHTRIPNVNTPFSVFQGKLGGQHVVVKMAENEHVSQLSHEAKMYLKLQTIQGLVIPSFHTLCFINPTCAILVMEDCGKALTSFSDLSNYQRYAS